MSGCASRKKTFPRRAESRCSSIDFPWSDKIEPRLGAAWDPTRKGTMKIFGSYGVVNDVMKLLLAQTSWGAQAYEQCAYALGPNARKRLAFSAATSTWHSREDAPARMVRPRPGRTSPMAKRQRP